jgi:hypothetical protein
MSNIEAVGLSCDPGFPAINEARRRSLCMILAKATRMKVRATLFAKAMLDEKSIPREHLKMAGMWIKSIDRQIELVWLQFPEGRADRLGKFDADDARTNEQLNADLNLIIDAFVRLSGSDRYGVRDWMINDDEVQMPPIRPVLAKMTTKVPPK